MTWQELKDFCNALPAAELHKNVIMWQEENAVTHISAMQLEEDHYIDIENEDAGCFPESEMDRFIEDADAYPEGRAGFERVYGKGFPLLLEKF